MIHNRENNTLIIWSHKHKGHYNVFVYIDKIIIIIMGTTKQHIINSYLTL